MSKELKIAVAGCGYWGKNLARNLHELGYLAAICDTDTDVLARNRNLYKELKFKNSFMDILSDRSIDAVAVSTPAEMHYQMVKDSLLSDKHVLVEKPLALKVEQGEELLGLSGERKKILMVGHLLHYHQAVLRLKGMIEDGELGKIQYIYSNRLNLGKIRREENILWSFAPHDISVILTLAGEMPEKVSSFGGYYLHDRIADVTLSNLSFPSGIKSHIFVSWLHPYKEQRLVVVGDMKMALFNDIEPRDKLILYPHVMEWKDHVPTPNKKEGIVIPVGREEPLREECRHFADCILNHKSPRTDGIEGLRVLRVLQACQESLESNGALVQVSGKKPGTQPSKGIFYLDKTSIVDEGCTIGVDTKIWHFSHIIKGSVIGSNCNIGQNVVIGPDVKVGNKVKIQNNVSVYPGVTLEDGVFCGPSMVFTNVYNPRSYVPRKDQIRPTLVKEGATLGANSTIICGHTIGRFAFVAAGSVVTDDIPDFALVAGNPAVIKGWICKCGLRLHFEDGKAICETCGSKYTKNEDAVSPVP